MKTLAKQPLLKNAHTYQAAQLIRLLSYEGKVQLKSLNTHSFPCSTVGKFGFLDSVSTLWLYGLGLISAESVLPSYLSENFLKKHYPALLEGLAPVENYLLESYVKAWQQRHPHYFSWKRGGEIRNILLKLGGFPKKEYGLTLAYLGAKVAKTSPARRLECFMQHFFGQKNSILLRFLPESLPVTSSLVLNKSPALGRECFLGRRVLLEGHRLVIECGKIPHLQWQEFEVAIRKSGRLRSFFTHEMNEVLVFEFRAQVIPEEIKQTPLGGGEVCLGKRYCLGQAYEAYHKRTHWLKAP